MRQSLHLAIAAVLLVALLGLAGCTFQAGGEEYPSDEEIRDRLTSLESIEADVITETRSAGNETAVRMHIVRDFEHDRYRATVRSGASAGATIVANGSTVRYYQPRTNTVQVIHNVPTDANFNRTVDTVVGLYDRLRDDGGEEPVGISPAPTVPTRPSGDAGSQAPLAIGENVSVSDGGIEEVDGREARVVEFDTGGTGLISNGTYWLDSEYHFPLKAVVSVRVGNRTTVAETTYRNVTFNGDVSDDQFTFEPPESARVIESTNGSLRTYRNRSAMVAATDRSVPDPAVPDRYSFESGELVPEGSGQAMTLVYTSDGGTLTVTKLAGVERSLEGGRSITVDGRAMRLRPTSAGPAIGWTCAGSTYSVLGDLEEAELRDVAASIGCE